VSRTFVERTREALGELMARPLGDLRLAVMMLDGLELKGRMMIVALGITTEGVKIPLGLWEGSTENATVATALLSDLVERGLDPEQGCCSSSMDPKRSGRLSARYSARSRSSAVCGTRSETCSGVSPSATVHRSRPGCDARGERLTTRVRWNSSPGSRTNSSTPTPVRPDRCARVWRRR
jgi:hypothetical protein